MTEEMMNDGNIRQVSLAQIVPSRWQPRAPIFDEEALWELAKSIQEIGLINPIVVFQEDDDVFELVAGERRTRALVGLALGAALNNHTPYEYVGRLANVGLAGLGEQERKALASSGATVIARVEPIATDDDHRRLHRIAVMENIERASLSPIEEANGLASLQAAYGWSQRELADEIGKSQGYVAQRLSLLDLPACAQEAVNTRVLNTTHARALASVPQRAADAVAQLVVRDVVEHGATTREVQSLTSRMSRFLDPDTYQIDNDDRYRPETRNRMRLMHHLVESRDADVDMLKREQTRLLSMYGQRTIQQAIRYWFDEAARVLGVDDVDEAWQTFAMENGYTCIHCQWRAVARQARQQVGDWPASFAQTAVPCRRLVDGNEEITTCWQYVGPADPAIVSLELLYQFRELDNIDVIDEPFSHVVYQDVSDFLDHYAPAAAAEQARKQAIEHERDVGHVSDIRRYYEWQFEQPDPVLRHFHAHVCHKCAHFVPPGGDGYDSERPPCGYVDRPLPGHGGSKRAPEFSVLLTRDGELLPRCERFTYHCEKRPAILRVPGACFGDRAEDRERILSWMRSLAQKVGRRAIYGVWAPLQWLDYERPRPESGRDNRGDDVDALIEYLRTVWQMPGRALDEELPTLIDCLFDEDDLHFSVPGTHLFTIQLLDPTTGEREEFIAFDLEMYLGYASGEEWPAYKKWPEGFVRPF